MLRELREQRAVDRVQDIDIRVDGDHDGPILDVLPTPFPTPSASEEAEVLAAATVIAARMFTPEAATSYAELAGVLSDRITPSVEADWLDERWETFELPPYVATGTFVDRIDVTSVDGDVALVSVSVGRNTGISARLLRFERVEGRWLFGGIEG